MATLILDGAGMELRRDAGALGLYDHGTRVRSVPISLVCRVIVQGDVTLSAGALMDLADAGVATVLLSARRGQRVAQWVGAHHGDAELRLAQYRMATADGPQRAAVARWLVFTKISRQRRLLNHALACRPDLRYALKRAVGQTGDVLRTLASQPQPCRDCDADAAIASLLGSEGAAARAYFEGYAKLFPRALEFNGRNRRPPADPVNATLSLSYTLGHAAAVHAAWSRGLDPYIGFLHAPTVNRESLACDAVELVRARIDHWVWRMFADEHLRPDHFGTNNGACLLGKAGRAIYYAKWEAQVAKPLAIALRTAGRRLALLLRRGGE
jgi:CRISP-associated protein Cas1